MNYIDNRGIHRSSGYILEGAESQLSQWLFQLLRFTNIDGHEFQNAILSDDAQNVRSIRLAVIRYERYSSGAGLKHASTGLVKGSLRVD